MRAFPPFPGFPSRVRLHGSLCAIVTPFDADGALDLPAFGRLLDRHVAAGTHGVVVAGSTGESAALDEGEFQRLLEHAIAHLCGRLPVIAGCSAAATHKALRLLRIAEAAGAQASLVATPYYVRPTQEGLFRHYAALADASPLPLLLYNVPGRTGCDLLPETVARLVGCGSVAGIKEARPERERMQALLALRQPGFAVFSGDDPTCLRALRDGADGVISVAANVCPGAFRALVDLAQGGRAEDAQALDARLAPLYQALALESNPIPAKWILHRLGLCGPGLRLPLVELSEPLRAEAEAAVSLARALEAAHTASAAGHRAA
jgi:4-hydroxy-tetrahydrodipicolinate synthase